MILIYINYNNDDSDDNDDDDDNDDNDSDDVTSKCPPLLTQGKAPMERRGKKRRRRTPEGKALNLTLAL